MPVDSGEEIVIKQQITSCSQCPHQTERRMYTEDSFEFAFDWFCTVGGEEEKIAGYVEAFDKPPIPDWCPFRKT